MDKEHIRQVRLLSVAHGLSHAFLVFFSPLLLAIRSELAIDYVALGGLVTVAFGAYGLGSLPAGYVADFIGHRNTVVISTALAALGALGAAAANSYWTLAAAFALIGGGGSLYHPAAMAYLAIAMKPSSLGRAMGLHGIGANVLLILAPIVTGYLAAFGSWRISFWVWGGIGLIVATTIRLVLPEVRAPSANGTSLPNRARATQVDSGKNSRWGGILTLAMAIVLILTALQGFVFGGANSYLAPYLQDELGAGVALSGVIMGILFAGGIPGQYLGGRMTDRHGRLLPVAVATIGSVITLTLIPALGTGFVLYINLFALGAFVFMLQPPMTALVSDVTRPEVKGLAFGLFFVMTNGAGALAPLLAGFLAQAAHLEYLFFWMAGLTLVSVPFIAWLGRIQTAGASLSVSSQ